MKKFIVKMMLILGLVVSIEAKAQSGFDNIVAALKSGNASTLSQYFDKSVEITTTSSENAYSKSQAEQVLDRFFSAHSPKNFTIVHQGTSPEGSKYVIGSLVTASGTFRTYIYAKQSGATMMIQQIRFEEQ